ncbi:MAG: hypothetical protein ACK49D_07985 [Flavobacteriia bacterium]|jgi:hypothetical protein
MRSVLFFVIFGFGLFSPAFAQRNTAAKRTVGLTAYYFWEEDSMGIIYNKTIDKPYLQNFKVIVGSELSKKEQRIRPKQLIRGIADFVEDNSNRQRRSRNFSNIDSLKFPLFRSPSEETGSILYIRQEGKWIFKVRKNVIYFDYDENNQLRFKSAKDSIVLSSIGVNVPTQGQYTVFSYWTKDPSTGKRTISRQEVWNYVGENVTHLFTSTKSEEPSQILVFSNGYRGLKKNWDPTDNLITNFDRYWYWQSFDDTLIARFNPDEKWYINGSMGVSTSTHRSMGGFGISYVAAKIFPWTKNSKLLLNQKENLIGFEKRKQQGRIAGKAFIQERSALPSIGNRKDTVNIVCHSMGYAYALGFIEEVKSFVVLGRFVIIAPEGACTDNPDWSLFKSAWQYGSAYNDGSPVSEQDGVAPQCLAKDIDKCDPCCFGKITMPKDWSKKGFRESHEMPYIRWIFESIPRDSPAYIRR